MSLPQIWDTPLHSPIELTHFDSDDGLVLYHPDRHASGSYLISQNAANIYDRR